MLVGNSRFTPAPIPTRPNRPETKEWTNDLDEWVPSQPLVNGDALLAKDTNGKLTAIELSSGQTLWTKQTPGERLKGLVVPNGPFIENTDQKLNAYDPQTGELLWSHLTAPKVYNPQVSGGGHLLVNDYLESGIQLRRLDPTTGDTLWTASANHHFDLISDQQVLAYTRDDDGVTELALHNLEDGEKLWGSSSQEFQTRLGIAGPNLLLQHRERHENGNNYPVTTARSLETGEITWQHKHTGHASEINISPNGTQLFFLEPRNDNWREVDLVALDTLDGSTNWSMAADSSQSLVVGRQGELLLKKRAYDGNEFTHKLQAIDSQTGQEIWQNDKEGGQLYASLQDGDFLELKDVRDADGRITQVSRIDSSTGSTEWTVTKEQAVTDFRLGAGESINLVSGFGTVTALDPLSGKSTYSFQSDDAVQMIAHNESGLVVLKDFEGKLQAIQTGPSGMMSNTPLFGDVPETDTGFNRVGLTETVRGVLVDGDLDGEVDAYDGVLVWKTQGEEQAQINRLSGLDELKALDKNKDGQLALSELEDIHVWYDYDGDDTFTDEDIVMGLTSGYDRARLDLGQTDLTLDRAYSSRAL